MTKLELQFKHKGLYYQQCNRSQHSAKYVVTDKINKHFRVFQITTNGDSEIFPFDDDTCAITVLSDEMATKQYNRYVEREKSLDFTPEVEYDAEVETNKIMKTQETNTGAATVEVVAINKKRGRPAVEKPALTYPSSESFTLKDLLTLNTGYKQPTMYLAVKKLIADGKMVDAGNAPHSGKGKPAKSYKLVA